MKLNLETGMCLANGTPVKYGDILVSKSTHDVIVKHHAKLNIPIVEIIDEDIIFTLDEFIQSWGESLSVITNVNIYEN